jgi:hypothetical protein
VKINPAVVAAFLFDLAKAKPPDLARARHMGAAAGLQIDLIRPLPDPHSPGLARSASSVIHSSVTGKS